MKGHRKRNGTRLEKKMLFLCMILISGLLLPLTALSAENVALSLRGATQGDIRGENPATSLGRENTIACVFFSVHFGFPIDSATPLTLGDVQCIKAIDKSSPILMNALKGNETMTGAMFRFFRPNPTGDGTLEQFYTIELTGAHVVDIRPWAPNTTDPASANLPPMEAISFDYSQLRTTYTNGGITSTIP